ncbi:MAG: SDR family oxidoreductase [Reichenbachiella sp.]
MKYFNNRTIWITGASSGIGEGFVNHLSDFDCNLVISARRTEELERVKDANENGKATIYIQPLDLGDENQVTAIAQKVLAEHKVVDLVIHCSGISQRSRVMETSIDVQRKLMEVNFFGTIHLATLLMPKMIEQKSGHQVVITSVMGKIGIPSRSGYAASKHALHGFFDSLRAEHHDDNIKVTLFCPGYIHTNLAQNALKGDGNVNATTDDSIANGLSVDAFVKKALTKIASQKEESYIGGFKEVLAIYVKRFFPSLFSKIAKGIKDS